MQCLYTGAHARVSVHIVMEFVSAKSVLTLGNAKISMDDKSCLLIPNHCDSKNKAKQNTAHVHTHIYANVQNVCTCVRAQP